MKNKKFEINGSKVNIPEGVVSKIYRLSGGVKKTIICNTPRQSFITFDGDLAEIWQTVFDDRGSLKRAYNYLAKNQRFEKKESRSALHGFIAQLEAPFLELSNKNPREDILDFVWEHDIFYELAVELTYRCNERCQHCYCPSGEKRREINTKTFKRLIDEFESIGGFKLYLTGGEILVREDIEDIFKILIGRNIIVGMISNLTLLDDKKLNLISEIKPISVGVTIHSAVPEIHDSITNVKGSFDRTIRSIKKLRKKGVPVSIKTMLFSKTVNSYIGVKKLATDLDCNVLFDFKVLPKLDRSDDNIGLRLTDKRCLLSIFADLDSLTVKKRVASKRRDYICGAGQYGLTISPYGDVRPCVLLVRTIGKYPDKSLSEMWNSLILKKVISKLKIENFKQCLKCPYLSACDMCIATWKEKNVPDSYTCFLTKLRYKDRI